MPDIPYFRVRIEQPVGVWYFVTPYLPEWNARPVYAQWSKRVGKDVLDVELWRRDERGERCVEHISLRTDLRASVTAAEVEQMSLWETNE